VLRKAPSVRLPDHSSGFQRRWRGGRGGWLAGQGRRCAGSGKACPRRIVALVACNAVQCRLAGLAARMQRPGCPGGPLSAGDAQRSPRTCFAAGAWKLFGPATKRQGSSVRCALARAAGWCGCRAVRPWHHAGPAERHAERASRTATRAAARNATSRRPVPGRPAHSRSAAPLSAAALAAMSSDSHWWNRPCPTSEEPRWGRPRLSVGGELVRVGLPAQALSFNPPSYSVVTGGETR
jgi:hypothetical protein